MELNEIVMKLVGRVSPMGESSVDKERLENMKALCTLTGDLINEIQTIASIYGHDYQYSVKSIADYAKDFLKEIKSSE